ncbi:MAG TPA: hypothetical protein VI935_04900 [Thermodesulfobacteriota bacterium]|nr:hypothetical protein [Thermodesulfobacteriota bacterium]
MGPLFDSDQDKTQKTQQVDALGPFITSKKSDTRFEYGFHPLFYLVEDTEKDSTEFDFLYPLATYDRRVNDRRFQFIFYLLFYETVQTRSGFIENEFHLFPFIFAKNAEDKNNSYFALFPVYGNLKNKFSRDEINFFLFPLFLRTTKNEATNYSFLWPFFGYYTGGGQKGFRFWPLFGYRKKEGSFEEKFALWPIFASKRRVFYGGEIRSLSVLPFYSVVESYQRSQTTYLWPFFNHLVDKRRGIERWDVPWPLLNFTRGKEEEETRIFPFYGSEKSGRDQEGFFLWPLYRYDRGTFEDHKRTRNSVLFILYSDIKEEPIIEGGRSGRRIDFWPLFTYKRDREGNANFHFLSIFEPFLSNNEGIERNYSSIWRLYQWKRYNDGRKTSSFLWNMFKSESGKEGFKMNFQPIIPVFSYKYWEGESKVYFLGGLFGYNSDPYKKTIKLFYIPINISSQENTTEEEVRKDE